MLEDAWIVTNWKNPEKGNQNEERLKVITPWSQEKEERKKYGCCVSLFIPRVTPNLDLGQTGQENGRGRGDGVTHPLHVEANTGNGAESSPQTWCDCWRDRVLWALGHRQTRSVLLHLCWTVWIRDLFTVRKGIFNRKSGQETTAVLYAHICNTESTARPWQKSSKPSYNSSTWLNGYSIRENLNYLE